MPHFTKRDPIYTLASSIYQHYQKTVIPQTAYCERRINDLQKTYMQALRDLAKDKNFTPMPMAPCVCHLGKLPIIKEKTG